MEVDIEKKNEKTFEVLLTTEQYKLISSSLPKGYSLQFTKGHQRREKSPGKPKKKLFLDEDLAIVQTPQKHFRKKPSGSVNSISERNSSYLTDNLSKRPFRDKKSKLHFDQKFESGETSNTYLQISSKSKFHSNELVRKCLKVLAQLKRHPKAGPFLEPVDYIALHIPDYPQIIKEPIDLGTIERYARGGNYVSWSHFLGDVKKVWTNSFTYNAKGSEIYLMTQEMNNYFEKLTRDIDSPLSTSNNQASKNINELQKKVEKLTKEISLLNNNNRPKKPSTHYTIKAPKNNSISERTMSIAEKRQLGQSIRNLPPECLRGVWEIVSRGMSMNEQNKEELEFDIDTLPTKVARDLEKYVKEKHAMLKKGKGRKKGRQAATSSNSAQKDLKHNDHHDLDAQRQINDNHKISNFANSSKDDGYRDNQMLNNNVARDLAYPEHKEPSDYKREHIHKNMAGGETKNFVHEDDEVSKSSDSSFITDSEDGFPSN